MISNININNILYIYTYGNKHHNDQHTKSQRKTRVFAKTMDALSQFGHQRRRGQRSNI